VSCCWWFYWNGANNNDKAAHAGNDLLLWWLNEVYWQDKIAGTRSVDLFDIRVSRHARHVGIHAGEEACPRYAHLSRLLGRETRQAASLS
jgi:hypothetical protein